MEVKIGFTICFHCQLDKWLVDAQDNVLLFYLELIHDLGLIFFGHLDIGDYLFILCSLSILRCRH